MSRLSPIAGLSVRVRTAGVDLLSHVPDALAYRVRRFAEKHATHPACCARGLPPIHQYWLHTHVRPAFERLGFSDADDFFARECKRAIAQRDGAPLRILSLGAGAGDAELDLADRLEHEADGGFHVTLVDLNASLLRRARYRATERGLAHRFGHAVLDCNDWPASFGARQFDVIVANQSLHHFLALESVLDRVHAMLADDGVFLVADTIGRNGHRPWPEVEREVALVFATLPERLRFDRMHGRTLDAYVPVDETGLGFEGVRSQDVLRLLVERFGFETFAPYGALVLPFVDRRFGPNFDVEREGDRRIVDEVAAREAALLRDGTIKPIRMIASLRKGAASLRTVGTLTPQSALRSS